MPPESVRPALAGEDVDGEDEGRPEPPGFNIRDFTMNRTDFGEGQCEFTEGCQGCRAIVLGLRHLEHSKACRGKAHKTGGGQ